MSNLDRVVALLTRHREERRWTDERVAADMLREFGIDPDADGLPVAPVTPVSPVAHEPWPVAPPVAEVVPEAELEAVPPEPEPEPEPVVVEAEPEPAAAQPAPPAEPEPDPPA